MKKFLSILLSVALILSCVSTVAFATDGAVVDNYYDDATMTDATMGDAQKLGDINGDGKVSVVDAKWVLQYVAGLRDFDDAQFDVADVTLDYKISVVDAKWILQVVAGLREFAEKTPDDAENNVDPNGPEMQELADAITAAQAVDTTGYTAESIAELENAVAEASALLGRDDVTAAQINEAIENMQIAEQSLATDKAPLEEAINSAYTKNTTGYDPAAVDAYYDVVEAAKAVLNDENATPEDVAAAVDAISTAEAGLVADKAVLVNAIANAEAVDTDGMTADSVAAFEQALNKAKEVNENASSTPSEVAAAAQALVNAQAALVVDKTALNDKITEADALDLTGYTTDSVAALTTALNDAKAVNDKADATPAEVAAAKTALDNALAGLTIDTTTFDAAYAAAVAVDTTGYTTETAQALADAIADADAVKANADATVADYANATQALNDAVAGLKADLTALEAAIATAELTDTTGMTAESVQALADAITAAQAITADNTPAEVAAAKAELDNAIAGLKADLTALEAVIATADSKNLADYTTETANALTAALNAAKAITADNTPAEVAAAKDALQTAIENLVSARADTTALEALIATAKTKVLSDYTDETANALSTAITEAETLVATPGNITTAQVDEATTKLQTALDNLVTLQSALDEKVKEAKDIDTTGFTPASVKALEDAVAAATSATDKKQAIADIDAAIAGLKVDKSGLEASIATATSTDTKGMTAESVQVLSEALAAAKAVNSKADAKVAEVAAAKTALDNALAGLTVDKTALSKAIEKAKNADTIGCTQTSIDALNTAIANAEAVLANGSATVAEVNTATANVTAARQNLADSLFDIGLGDGSFAIIDWA